MASKPDVQPLGPLSVVQEYDPDGKYQNMFPELDSVVHPRAIHLGLEWAYVRGASIGKFQDLGWSLCHRADPFKIYGESWVVMVRGEPIRSSVAFVPKVYAEVTSR